MKILHLTFDYPDAVTPETTHAIKRLIACADSIGENHCLSFHRTRTDPQDALRRFDGHSVICRKGRLYPFGMRRFLRGCARIALQSGIPGEGFDLIHAHKLTLEGYIARELKRSLGIPYCVSVRTTDFRVLRYKPWLRADFVSILSDSERICLLAPWMKTSLRSAFGSRWCADLERKLLFLGNVVDGKMVHVPSHNGRYAMPLVANLSQLQRKNVLRSLEAVKQATRAGRSIRVDIIGSGTGIGKIRDWVARLGLEGQVGFPGKVPHAEMIPTLSGYKALLLCSYPETFGLVYLEALRAGIPIIHSRGTGVDGVFPMHRIGIAAAHDSVSGMACALAEMEERYPAYKSSVAALQGSGALDGFSAAGFARKLSDELYLPLQARPAPIRPVEVPV